MRYIFICNTVWHSIGSLKVKRTPVAAYIPNKEYTDMLSGDGKTIMTEVRGNINNNTLNKIKKDQDVLECLELDMNDDNDEGDADEPERRKARRTAGRFGVPDAAIGNSIKRKQIVKLMRRRFLISQALRGESVESAKSTFEKMKKNLRGAGFTAHQLDNDDTEDQLLTKLLAE